jgi:hypothetical protein
VCYNSNFTDKKSGAERDSKLTQGHRAGKEWTKFLARDLLIHGDPPLPRAKKILLKVRLGPTTLVSRTQRNLIVQEE